jgi:hypothetical protein
MPLFAAGLGVLGGIGGALIGGYLANEGAERRFEQERTAQVEDLRTEAYGTFLGTSLELATDLVTARSQDELADGRLYAAQGKAIIVAHDPDAIDTASTRVADTVILPVGATFTQDQIPKYNEAVEAFLDLARSDITAGE